MCDGAQPAAHWTHGASRPSHTLPGLDRAAEQKVNGWSARTRGARAARARLVEPDLQEAPARLRAQQEELQALHGRRGQHAPRDLQRGGRPGAGPRAPPSSALCVTEQACRHVPACARLPACRAAHGGAGESPGRGCGAGAFTRMGSLTAASSCARPMSQAGSALATSRPCALPPGWVPLLLPATCNPSLRHCLCCASLHRPADRRVQCQRLRQGREAPLHAPRQWSRT